VPTYRAIENLIAAYAERVDDGDFAGLGDLLANAVFTGSGPSGSGPSVSGREAIETMFQDTLTVLQALPGFPLQPVAVGRYHDTFERRDGQWRFTQRRVHVDLAGDVSRRLRRPT
jgi:ketosteroid isomerase-like protein